MKQKGKLSSKSDKRASSYTILQFIWIFVLIWLLVLVFFWQSGYLHSSKNQTLRLVDSALSNTENSIKNKLLRIHVPQISGNIHQPPLQRSNHNQQVTHVLDWKDTYDIHVVFSTDCGAYQDWQSLVVFHSAQVVKQPGPVTRIASGCDESKKVTLLQF